MQKVPVRIEKRKILADIITPVSIYLKVRDIYPNSLLLESSDYHSKENSYSFICLDPLAEFRVSNRKAIIDLPGSDPEEVAIDDRHSVVDLLNQFISSFTMEQKGEETMVDGVFGYTTYDAVEYFEDIRFQSQLPASEEIPEIRYNFFRYVLAINHLSNELVLFEHIVNGGNSEIDTVTSLLHNRNIYLTIAL